MRKALLAGLVSIALVLPGCGGGSGNSLVTGNGNGGGGGGGQVIAGSGPNVATLTVDAGPGPTYGAVDTAYVTVTFCVPGSASQCQTFDHIELDSASFGLRLLADAKDTSGNPLNLTLPQETNGGNPIVECTQFVDGYSWGPIKTADVLISGETAGSVPIQVIGDPGYTTVPSACSSTGTQEDTVSTFGANGILGVGPFAQDCGSACVNSANNTEYYICSGSACQPSTASLAEQVTDPVFDFQTDNNGIIVELPSLGNGGTAATVTGALVFGIGTAGNNALTGQTVLTADNYGDITTSYNGQSLPYSFLDTGSNAYYFDDSSISTCPSSVGSTGSWFCPSSTLTLSATNMGQNGQSSTVTFYIANANTMFNQYLNNTAFDNIGASAGNESSFCPNNANNCAFDFGLPFFFGRNVYVAFDGQLTSAGNGPYFAY